MPFWGHRRAPNRGVRVDEAFFSFTWVQMLIQTLSNLNPMISAPWPNGGVVDRPAHWSAQSITDCGYCLNVIGVLLFLLFLVKSTPRPFCFCYLRLCGMSKALTKILKLNAQGPPPINLWLDNVTRMLEEEAPQGLYQAAPA